LLKELQLAIDQGHSAIVIKFNLSNWSQVFEQETESSFKSVRFIELSASRYPFLPWLISLLLEQACRLMPSSFLSAKQLSFAAGRRSYLILRNIKKLNQTFDLIVAHNPQSFYPALVASKKFNAKLGIDMEDYHPGETNNKSLSDKVLLLLKHTLPHAYYISYASPCFYDIVNQKISLNRTKQIVLLNGFPSTDFTLKNSHITKLSLVWFSQHINGGRGLEPLLDAMADFSDQVELHLIGQLNPTFDRNFVKGKKGIYIHSPKSQQDLHEFLCDFDIGVACDVPVNLNRDLALTNKIIAYAQAGLFILATHTKAQDKFLHESALEYAQVKPEIASYYSALKKLLNQKIEFFHNRENRFKEGQKYSWDNLREPLNKIWSE